jgi:hypothetical protein
LRSGIDSSGKTGGVFLLMRSTDHAPVYHLRAVVDRLSPMVPTVSWTDDVVEI